jgi:Na+-transporting methylmalonyl-CoA/oxaloacetate decarboxylase gamma subunit
VSPNTYALIGRGTLDVLAVAGVSVVLGFAALIVCLMVLMARTSRKP